MEPKKRNDLNVVNIGGYLTSDPVERDSGIYFTVAVRRDKDHTDFLPACIRGERGKKYTFLKKGSSVVISGHLHQWKGDKGSRLMVEADRIHFGAVGLNNVALTGRLTSDPEPFTATSGKKGYHVSLATERTWKSTNAEGGLQSHTSFIDLTVWSEAMEYMKKGAMCTVVGALQSRNYKNNEGENRTAYQVASSRVAFAPKRDDENAAEQSDAPAAQTPQGYANAPQYSVPDFDVIDDDDDDFPF